jgi:hypothetical protein
MHIPSPRLKIRKGKLTSACFSSVAGASEKLAFPAFRQGTRRINCWQTVQPGSQGIEIFDDMGDPKTGTHECP